MGSVVGETLATNKLPPKLGLGKGKGLMKGVVPVTKKCPVLLREDSGYALKQLSSIIKDDNYKDFGNHATKAIGETGLFNLAQVCLSITFHLFHPIVVSFQHSCLILTRDHHDERSYGPLCAPQDSDQPFEGEGRGKGVGDKGANGLERGPSQQA